MAGSSGDVQDFRFASDELVDVEDVETDLKNERGLAHGRSIDHDEIPCQEGWLHRV